MRSSVRGGALVVLLTSLAGCEIIPTPIAPEPESTSAPAPPTPAPAEPEPARDGPLPVPTLPAPPAVAAAPTGVPLATAAVTAEPAPAIEVIRQSLTADFDQLRAWLNATGRRALLVARPANYAWLTAGADGDLGEGVPAPTLAVLRDRTLVVAPSDGLTEARSALRGLGWQGLAVRWDVGRDDAALVRAVRSVAGVGVIAADTHLPGTEYVRDELLPWRLTLGQLERERLAWLAAVTGETVAGVVGLTRAEMTEAELAGRLAEALRQAGVVPRDVRVVALDRLESDGLTAAGPTTLDSGAAVHVTAARWGLLATVGRTVTPEARPEASEAAVTARWLYVALAGAVQPGAALREVYAAAARSAAAQGAPEVYRTWSPGGVGAYEVAARPFAPAALARLEARQAVTIAVRLPRAYLADTLLVMPDRVQQLTVTPGWPSPAAVINGRPAAVPTLRGGELAVAEAEQARVEAEARAAALSFLQETVGGAITDGLAGSAEPDA